MTTAIIADDHPALRSGLKQSLEQYPDVQVIGEAGSGPELTTLLAQREPDVLLLDISMPDFDIYQFIPTLRKAQPKMKIIIVTAHDDDIHIHRLIGDMGVDGYLLREEDTPTYIRAIRTVANGKSFFSQRVVSIFLAPTDGEKPALTDRELVVLRLLATGASMSDIAKQLYITRRTVQTHAGHIYQKLGVGRRVEAVVEAMRQGILNLDH